MSASAKPRRREQPIARAISAHCGVARLRPARNRRARSRRFRASVRRRRRSAGPTADRHVRSVRVRVISPRRARARSFPHRSPGAVARIGRRTRACSGSPLAGFGCVRATMRAAAGSDTPSNIRRDRQTIAAMMRIHCRDRHGRPHDALCQDCAALARYADTRLVKCPFGSRKTTCKVCPTHCYRPDQRAAIRVVMREAGPKMLFRHPVLALRHLWIERQGPRPWPTHRKGRLQPALRRPG